MIYVGLLSISFSVCGSHKVVDQCILQPCYLWGGERQPRLINFVAFFYSTVALILMCMIGWLKENACGDHKICVEVIGPTNLEEKIKQPENVYLIHA